MCSAFNRVSPFFTLYSGDGSFVSRYHFSATPRAMLSSHARRSRRSGVYSVYPRSSKVLACSLRPKLRPASNTTSIRTTTPSNIKGRHQRPVTNRPTRQRILRNNQALTLHVNNQTGRTSRRTSSKGHLRRTTQQPTKRHCKDRQLQAIHHNNNTIYTKQPYRRPQRTRHISRTRITIITQQHSRHNQHKQRSRNRSQQTARRTWKEESIQHQSRRTITKVSTLRQLSLHTTNAYKEQHRRRHTSTLTHHQLRNSTYTHTKQTIPIKHNNNRPTTKYQSEYKYSRHNT